MQHQIARKYSAEHIAAREQLLSDALKAGKILLSSFQRWEREYDCDPEGTASVVASLAAAPTVAASVSALTDDRQYDSNWLTEGERRRAVGTSTAAVRTMND